MPTLLSPTAPPPPTLLVVDDEANVLYSLVRGLKSASLEVITAQTGQQGFDLVQQGSSSNGAAGCRPDVVILDVRLPDISGLDLFDRIHQFDPRLPVIIITAFGATDTAIEAMKRGAFEYLLKPVDLHQLKEVVSRALELSRFRHVAPILDDAEGQQQPQHQQEQSDNNADRIVGRCPAMQSVYKAIGRVAPSDVPVLILGESGTGKELIARALYHHSRRAKGPFLAINCAAIPENLLESELFGHERGAFTSADRRRIGKFEQCHQGTLFLDEIGDMSAATQAKVLRLLQEQRFERLGGNEPIQTDVRLLAATNKDLEAEVEAGRFRKDLLYRLNVFTIRLPALRERREDLPVLVEHFMRRFGRSLGRAVHSLTPEAWKCLQDYNWPGNVRELQSVLKYSIIQAGGEVITRDNLPEGLRAASCAAPAAAADAASPEEAPLSPPAKTEAGAGGPRLEVAELMRALLRAGEPDIYRRVNLAVDRVVLELVLRHVNGNQVQASDLLGISRTTLRAKMRALGILVERSLLSDSDQQEGV